MYEANFDFKRYRISRVAIFTLFFGVFRGHFEMVAFEIQLHLVAEIPDRREVFEYFSDTVFEKLAVRILLHLDEVRHFANLVDLRKRTAFGVPVLHLLDSSSGH